MIGQCGICGNWHTGGICPSQLAGNVTLSLPQPTAAEEIARLTREVEATEARLAEAVAALRAAMDDTPGWYDLARDATRADGAREGGK